MRGKKAKILVAMSGGVDSSVVAALLVKAGFDVTGMFAVNYEDNADGRSCWRGDYQDALRVCAKLGIKLLRWDFTGEYRRDVLNYMYREYRAGRTPNPDVLCNKFVKFGAWLKKAKAFGFDYLATGHYARVKDGRLFVAQDKNKDQTYFLHQLNVGHLKQVMFPIGKHTKPQVRALAKKFGLPTAEKEESMGICFVGEVPMKEFLQKKIKPRPGKIVSTAGEILGEHQGLPFYTIGERLGLKSKPYFVVSKNQKKNELIVGPENDPALFTKEITVGEVNWVSGQTPKFPLKCLVRLRHRQPLQKCHCEPLGKSNLLVKFGRPQRAVTPGQFAVFYLKGECLGGGVIR